MIIAAKGDSGFFQDLNDFFKSDTWNAIQNALLLIVAVFWLATAYWVFKDARRRIEDRWLVALATIVGLVLPFVGVLVYLLFRPPEYIEDVRERELEILAMQEALEDRNLHCPVCRAKVDASFLVCPVCTTRLKQACETCKSPLEPLWQVCPYCETPVASAGTVELGPVRESRRRERQRERERRRK